MSNKKVKSIYTIELDEIDINLLQFRSYIQNKRLWSLNNNSSPCYYNFEVMAARRDVMQEDRDDTSTNDEIYKTYKCHICNINVPIAFMKEHNNSTIHKTYTGIANNAMERIKLHMNLELEAAPTKRSSVHFCEICVLVIKKTDRVEHEKSRVHEISMTHDRLFRDLANVYLNDNFKVESSQLNDQNAASKTNDIANKEIDPNYQKEWWWGVEPESQAVESKKKNKILEKNPYFHLLESNGNLGDNKTQPDHKINPNHVKFNDLVKKADNVIVSENISVQSNNMNGDKKDSRTDDKPKYTRESLNSVVSNSKIRNEVDWIDVKAYIDNINALNDGNLIAVTEEGRIVIKTVSGDILEVSLAQFCGYIKFKTRNEWGCNVCQSFIVSDASGGHEYIEQHVNGILLPLKDKNCLRVLNDIYQHCVLCNLLLKTSYVFHHITLESHIAKIKEAFIYNEKLLRESTLSLKHEDTLVPKYELCEPCGRDIYTPCMPSHRLGKTHLKNVEKLKEEENSNTRNIDHCATCIRDIYTQDMPSHQNSKTHLINLKKLPVRNQNVDQNNALKETHEDECDKKSIEVKVNEKRIQSNEHLTERADGNTVKCEICDESIPSDVIAVGEHLCGAKHTRRLDSFLQNNCFSKNANGYFCRACCQNVPSGIELNHIREQNHKDKMSQADKYGSTSSYCGICCVDVGVVNMPEHTKGKKHQQNAKKLNEKPQVNNIPEITKTDEVMLQMEMTENPNSLLCKICTVKVPKNNEREHVLGLNHKNNLAPKLLANKMKKVATGYYCEACKIYTHIGHMFNHSHLSKINKPSQYASVAMSTTVSQSVSTDSDKYCNVCKSYIYSGMGNHIIGKSHKDAVKKLNQKTKKDKQENYRNQMLVTDDLEKIINQVCNINTVEHSQNCVVNHTVDNGLENGYYCNICNGFFADSTEMDHIFSNMHKKNVANVGKDLKVANSVKVSDVSTYFCDVCEVRVPNNANNIEAHNKGLPHNTSLKKLNNI